MEVFGVIAVVLVVAIFPLAQLILDGLSAVKPDLSYPDLDIFGKLDFDFIIVGGGTAGCVLANRLTEVPNWTVLLVEAGDAPSLSSTVPTLFPVAASPKYEWGYNSYDDKFSAQSHKTKNIHLTRGKGFGGCSIINYMYYVRGNRADYDGWEMQGNVGWGWTSVLPYMKKSERLNDMEILKSNSSSLHSDKGLLGITKPIWKEAVEFLKIFKQNGRDIHLDTNGYRQIGYSLPQYSIDDETRQSTEHCFLKPATNRPNLYIMKNTFVRKIIIDNNTAVAVEVKKNNDVTTFKANKEIILSAGVFNSPQLLMLSGIGPKEQLDKVKIETIVDNADVGRNMEDHPMVMIAFTAGKDPSPLSQYTDILNNLDKIPIPLVIGFGALDKNQQIPDYQMIGGPLHSYSILGTILCSALFGLDDDICASLTNAGKQYKIFLGLFSLLHPKSKGNVTLQSNNPEDKPIITTNYFSDGTDLEKFAKCLEDYLTVVNTTNLKKVKSQVVNMNVKQCKDLEFGKHDYWKCYILNTVNTNYHSVGTCRMGVRGDGVVDARLRVWDIDHMRVIDSSVMPSIVSGNPMAATIMIAEKGADMIKNDHGVDVKI